MTAMVIRLSAPTALRTLRISTAPDAPARAPGYRTVLRLLWRAWRRRQSRISIASLSPAMLKDIGVTPAEAEYEANKAFWRA